MEHSKNFDKIKRWFDMKLWTEDRVRKAVTANPPWITADEFKEITGKDY
jgi:hypothetical protein